MRIIELIPSSTAYKNITRIFEDAAGFRKDGGGGNGDGGGNDLRIMLDPVGALREQNPNITADQVMEYAGLVWGWIRGDDPDDFYTQVEKQYGPLIQSTSFSLEETYLVSKYDEPPLPPYIVWDRASTQDAALLYEYSFMAFVTPGAIKIARVD